MEETIKKIHQLCREIYEYLDERFIGFESFGDRPYVKESISFHGNLNRMSRGICKETVNYNKKTDEFDITINEDLSYINSTYEKLSADWTVIKNEIELTNARTLESQKNDRIKQLEEELNALKSK